MKISALNRKLHRAFGGRVTAALEDNCIVLRGELGRWDDVVRAGQMAATKYSTCHVVNDITFTGGEDAPMRVPALRDDTLDGQAPDVLIIGGGISGVSIARELTRQKLDILVVDKECDLALGASGRNDGEVHPGIDLGRGSIKHKYIRRGNAMYDQVCKELDVPFSRVGQYVCFQHGWLRPAVWGYCMWRKYHDGIADTELISGRELLRREPNFNEKTRFAISNPDSGCVCPYGLTIAYAENAVQNGARIALNTAVLGMDVADGRITAVHTNRGTLHPALVINAAGVFAEDVARMADDRFFSIHPRRGTNSILDRKAGAFMHSIASVKGSDMVSKTHSKGGGILHTVHDNLLIGPDAVETYEKENTATHPESIAHVFEKQKITMPALTERDIITYFTGVRAPTFEEDFIIERGRIAQQAMHRNRFTLDELTQELRNQGILDIASVEYAVLETNGQLNIILAPAQQPVTAEQMQIETEDTGYFSILINNGRILRDNLKRMGRDERWLQKQVQQRGTQCIEDVYLLMMNDAGQIYFAAKERR